MQVLIIKSIDKIARKEGRPQE